MGHIIKAKKGKRFIALFLIFFFSITFVLIPKESEAVGPAAALAIAIGGGASIAAAWYIGGYIGACIYYNQLLPFDWWGLADAAIAGAAMGAAVFTLKWAVGIPALVGLKGSLIITGQKVTVEIVKQYIINEIAEHWDELLNDLYHSITSCFNSPFVISPPLFISCIEMPFQ